MPEYTPDFTIAIPTYNGEHRLPLVLDCLRQQVGLDAYTWEVWVIDNNSTDHTREVVRHYQQDFPCPLHYGLESRQGAGFARQHAVRVAASELVGFLDDDNLPAPDWVAQAIAFGQHHPAAGAWGSQIHPDYEIPPPEGFRPLQPFLAIVERGQVAKLYSPRSRLLPPSAGLVVRRDAWLQAVPEYTVLAGRRPGNMLTGEDLEAIAYLQKAGWEIWYNPTMEMYHRISAQRLERSYLLPFFRGIGRSRHVTRMVNTPTWWRFPMTLAYGVNDARKLLAHLIKYRQRAWRDLIPACQLQLLLGSLQSPFYLYFSGYLSRHIPKRPSPLKASILASDS
jgi:glycosyltransferase involved in cell wall biosynthesis